MHLACKEAHAKAVALWRDAADETQTHPDKGAWQELVNSDMQTIGVIDKGYEVMENRQKWHQVCMKCLRSVTNE